MENHEITISKTEDGFVAAATSSPYFCFIAPTEQAVKERVMLAVAFYHRVHQKPITARVPPKVEITRLVPSSRMSTRELAVA